MKIVYHVSCSAEPKPGTEIIPNAFGQREKVSAFVRARVQGIDAFTATLTAAQYADAVSTLPHHAPRASKWAAEGILEYVRCVRQSTRPERYLSVFAFESTSLAERFIQEHRPEEGGVIYVCEVPDSRIVYRADMAMVTEIADRISKSLTDFKYPLKTQIDVLENLACQYWSGTQDPAFPEILISGPVTVIEKLK